MEEILDPGFRMVLSGMEYLGSSIALEAMDSDTKSRPRCFLAKESENGNAG